MGTNFYAVVPLKKRELKERINSAIDNDNLDEACEILEEATSEHEIHLGKRSGGWKFLFNANEEKYYPLTKDGINKFIDDNNAVIKDEYGRDYTKEEFWEDVKIFNEKGVDAEGYHRENPDEPDYYYTYCSEVLKKYKPNRYGEFYSDGLRFTTCSDFS